jgi:hypothetical protein
VAECAGLESIEPSGAPTGLAPASPTTTGSDSGQTSAESRQDGAAIPRCEATGREVAVVVPPNVLATKSATKFQRKEQSL